MNHEGDKGQIKETLVQFIYLIVHSHLCYLQAKSMFRFHPSDLFCHYFAYAALQDRASTSKRGPFPSSRGGTIPNLRLA